MKVTITKGPVLHPFPVDPEHETKRTQEHATLAAQGEPHDPKALDLFNFELGGYSLRFEDGETYEVDEDTGRYFIANQWATEVPADVKLKASNLAKPFDTRETTDEDAERFENESKARAAQMSSGGTQEPDLDVHDSTTESGTAI